MRWLVLGVVVAACNKTEPPAPKPELKPPLAVRFGDCAAADTSWISGPAPAAFNDAAAAARGRVPLTTYDLPPFSIEINRREGLVPQIRVPRAEVSNSDSEMPAGDEAEMHELRFRPNGAYAGSFGSEPMLRDLGLFVALSGERLARCFDGSDRVGFSQQVNLRFTLTPRGERTTVGKILADGIPAKASECIKTIVREYKVREDPEGVLEVNARFELRHDPARPPPPATIDHLFDPERSYGMDPIYKPSAGNPLVALGPAITRCLEASAAPYGAVVVDLAKHAVFGVDGRTAACIATATTSVRSDRRCSLSYGTMPLADLPTIDVAEAPAAIDLAARQAKLRSASPVVAIYGVNVIRAKDSTPMKHVAREMSRVLLAGEDFLLARATKTGWELFDPPSEPFPVVPVPIGTGAFWNRVPAPGKPGTDCDCVYYSLLATKTAVWAATSRTNEQIEIKRDAKFATALASELARAKHTNFFADRSDIEIGASDGATYGQLLDLVVAARAAGFTEWRLRPANMLHASIDLPEE